MLEADFPLRLYNRAESMDSDVAGLLRYSVKFMSGSIKIITVQIVRLCRFCNKATPSAAVNQVPFEKQILACSRP